MLWVVGREPSSKSHSTQGLRNVSKFLMVLGAEFYFLCRARYSSSLAGHLMTPTSPTSSSTLLLTSKILYRAVIAFCVVASAVASFSFSLTFS